MSRLLDGTILTWNLGTEQLFGYTPQEAIGRSIEIVAPPHLHGSIEKQTTILKDGGRVPATETVR